MGKEQPLPRQSFAKCEIADVWRDTRRRDAKAKAAVSLRGCVFPIICPAAAELHLTSDRQIDSREKWSKLKRRDETGVPRSSPSHRLALNGKCPN